MQFNGLSHFLLMVSLLFVCSAAHKKGWQRGTSSVFESYQDVTNQAVTNYDWDNTTAAEKHIFITFNSVSLKHINFMIRFAEHYTHCLAKRNGEDVSFCIWNLHPSRWPSDAPNLRMCYVPLFCFSLTTSAALIHRRLCNHSTQLFLQEMSKSIFFSCGHDQPSFLYFASLCDILMDTW